MANHFVSNGFHTKSDGPEDSRCVIDKAVLFVAVAVIMMYVVGRPEECSVAPTGVRNHFFASIIPVVVGPEF